MVVIAQDKSLSDYKHLLSTGAGLYLIEAGTGCGKTVLMTTQSDSNNDAVVFPQKSIKAQQEVLAEQSNRQLNVLQLEHFVDMTLADFESMSIGAIHIDEIQLIYECDYRATAISKLREQLVVLSKHYPVYCYSGTYKHEFSPLEFDAVYRFSKSREPLKYDVIHTSAKKEIDGYNGITTECLVKSIKAKFSEFSKPVLFFNNNNNQNIDIANELKKLGLRCVTINRESIVDKNHVFHELAKKERIADMGVDVVLTTSALEEGINVHDAVTVIGVQTAPERIVQQFGRARNQELAHYVLITGIGEQLITERQSKDKAVLLSEFSHDKSLERARNGISEQAVFIEHEKHKHSVMGRAIQVQRLQRPAYGIQVISDLKNYGYEPSGVYEFDSDVTIPLSRLSKRELAFAKLNNASVETLHEQTGMNTQIIESHFAKFDLFESRINESALKGALDIISNDINKYQEWIAQAYQTLSEESLSWLMHLTDNQLKQLQELVQLVYSSKKTERLKRTELIKTAHAFYESLYISDDGDMHDDWTGSRSWYDSLDDKVNQPVKLFRFLLGYEYDNSNAVFVLNKQSWWECELSRSEQASYTRKLKAVPDKEQFHEQTQLTQRDVLKTKPKVIRQLTDDIIW